MCDSKESDNRVGGNECLHFAMPGVVDWWVYLAFNEMKVK